MSAQKHVGEGELERVRRYQRILLALGRYLVADRDPQVFMNHAVAEVSQATEIARVKVLQYRPDHGDLLVVAGVGWKEGVIGIATLPIDVSSPPGRAIQVGEPTVINDIRENTEYRLSGLLKAHDIRALVNVPIFVDGASWGVLEVDSREPMSFTDDTVSFLQAVAQLVASAVQRAERLAAANEARRQLAAEAEKRSTLLREMQHRVKNNFQVISNMLLLQRRKAAGDEARQVLGALADRVTAIALAHDQLDPGRDLETVNVARYLGALCRTFSQMEERISVATNFDDAELPIEIAVPIGLIVNELVTNAMKHAFDETGSVAGNIQVEFRVDVGAATATLVVADDGKGTGEAKRAGSSGLALVEALAGQLGARVERPMASRGTRVKIGIPLRAYLQQPKGLMPAPG